MKEALREFNKAKAAGEAEALKAAVDELNAMQGGVNEVEAHSRAEDILCEYLKAIGAAQLANAFDEANNRVGFWYE